MIIGSEKQPQTAIGISHSSHLFKFNTLSCPEFEYK